MDEDDTKFDPLHDDSEAEELQPESWNRNVVITLALTGVSGFSNSIWSGAVLVAIISILAGGKDASDSNTKVGLVEAAQGIAMLVVALPTGYAADKYGRAPEDHQVLQFSLRIIAWYAAVLRIGSVLLLVACGLLIYTLYTDLDFSSAFYLWIAALSMNGLASGTIYGPAQALFADSVPLGSRTYWYNLLNAMYMLPSVAGPCFCIGLFQAYGDDWTIDQLRPIMLVGVICTLPVAVLMTMLSDRHARPESQLQHEEEVVDKLAEDEDEQQEQRAEHKCCGVTLTLAALPYILFSSDMLIALGSGMTIKFFPLFFKDDLRMSPSVVQAIYGVGPVMIVIFSTFFVRVAKSFGRIQTIMLTRLLGVSLLYGMAALFYNDIKSKWIFVPAYLLRTALLNCTYPLDESVLMDHVPANVRGRWKSLESVSSFGWCGSAALGGILADKYDYATTFVFTATLQGLGALVQIPLLALVPVEEVNTSKGEWPAEKLERCWRENEAVWEFEKADNNEVVASTRPK